MSGNEARMPRRGWWREGWRLVAADGRGIVVGWRVRRTIVASVVGLAVLAVLGLVFARQSVDVVKAVLLLSPMVVLLALSLTLTIHRFRRRPFQYVDGYISDEQAVALKEATRKGDLTGLPPDVRRQVRDRALLVRRVFPPMILGNAALLASVTLYASTVVLLGEGAGYLLAPVAVVVLNGASTLMLLQILGSTSATLAAEARAVARAAEEPGG